MKNLTFMKKHKLFKLWLLAVILFAGSGGVWGQVNTGSLPATFSQNFNTLSSTAPATWTDNSTPLVGWYSTVTTLNPNAGTTNINNVYNFGTASATDRALGAISTATTHRSAIRIKNNSGSDITSLAISYNGEQWRQNAASQTLVFDYQVGASVTSLTTGTWTSYTALDFVSPNTGTAGALDGNLTANRTAKTATIPVTIAAGSEIMLRWTKSGSNSHGLAIDDLVITATATSSSTPPTVSAAPSPTVDASFDVTFTDDAAWRGAITSITVGGTNLDASAYDKTAAGKITFTPSASALLQSVGTKNIVIVATGYNNATVSQTIGAGAATKLAMKTQPAAPATNGVVLATQPAVYIQDQYGNTTTSTASVTAAVGAGTWTIGGKTAKAGVSGTATFTDLTATSAAAVTGATISFTSGTLTGVTSGAFNIPAPPLNAPVATSATSVSASGFTANWDAVSGATEYYLDVATNPSFINSNLTTIVGWNFPNNPDDATADIGISENSSKNLTTNAVSSITFTPMTNPVSTTSVASAFTPNTWADGMGSKYWEIEFSTSGYTIIRFSSLQRSSNSGPRDFKVQYKIGSNGTYSDVPGGTITVANDWSTGQLSNISLPGTCDNQSSVYLRWIMSSNTGVNGSVVANTGTSSIDNIIIESNGTSNIISGYDNLLVSGTSQTVTGLSPNTTYYYRVRATSANSTSANSNTVTAFTAIDGTVNASAMPDCPTCDVVVANGGTLTVDATKTYNSVVIAPLGHLTLNDTKTLSVSGNLTILSDANGTGTLVDANAAGGLTVTGTTNVEQWLTVARKWWYLSSPLSAAKTTTFTPSNKIGTYNEATSTYSNPLATDVSLEVGRGYVVKLIDAADKAYTFTGGNLNTGDKTLTLTRTGNTAPKRGFNLVGNPYPSYIDWDLVFDPATATNMRNAIWFRTYVGSSMTFYTYSDGDGVPDQASSLIAPMQAFWVKVDADPATNETVSNGSLTFKNTHRSHFVTGANPLKVKALDARPRLRLVVSNGTATDEMLVVGKPYASDVLDSYDIEKFSNDNNAIPEVYSVISNQELVINSMNALTEGKTVTLGFRPGQTGTNFTIEATQLDNIDAKVMLLDKEEETEQELTAGTLYSFEVTDATPTTDRFVISLVSKVPTGVETGKLSGEMTVYTNRNNRIEVIYHDELSSQTTVSVYNVAGQKLSTQKLVKTATELSGTFNPGVYLIQLTDNGKKITQKLIIK